MALSGIADSEGKALGHLEISAPARDAFQARFGPIDEEVGRRMSELLLEFLHEATDEKKKKEPVGSH